MTFWPIPVSRTTVRRKVEVRTKNHEGSVRRFNDRTSLGLHMITAHNDLRPVEIKRRGTVDLKKFFKSFSPKIIKRGHDTLDTYLWEGLMIEELQPSLNTMKYNGFLSIFTEQ